MASGALLTGGVKAYARHRKAKGWPGGTPAGVRKADERGQVVWNSPGLIDFVATDARWPPDPSAARAADADQGVSQAEPPLGRPRRGRGKPDGGTATAGSPLVEVRRPDRAGSDKLAAQAVSERVRARMRMRQLAKEEGRLMDTARAFALMGDVVGVIRDRGEALPDGVTDDLSAMVEDDLRRAAAGEPVVFDRAAVHALLTEAVREMFAGAADAISALREKIAAEAFITEDTGELTGP